MDSSGKQRPTSIFRFRKHFRVRKSLIAAGVAFAAAAAGWAIAAVGTYSGNVAAQSVRGQAELVERGQDRTARSAPHIPEASASPTEAAKAAEGTEAPSVAATATFTARPKPTAHRTAKSAARRSSANTAAYEVVRTGSCAASYYDEGVMTASGESFDPGELTAAHKTLDFGTKVRVINKNNGESVVVRINDRGPFAGGRCLDLTTAAMEAVGGIGSGVIQVRYQVLAAP